MLSISICLSIYLSSELSIYRSLYSLSLSISLSLSLSKRGYAARQTISWLIWVSLSLSLYIYIYIYMYSLENAYHLLTVNNTNIWTPSTLEHLYSLATEHLYSLATGIPLPSFPPSLHFAFWSCISFFFFRRTLSLFSSLSPLPTCGHSYGDFPRTPTRTQLRRWPRR